MNKALAKTLEGIDYRSQSRLPRSITHISCDSRDIRKGSLFFAISGAIQDGHQYVEQACQNGAIAAVTEHGLDAQLPLIITPDTKSALSRAAANFYGHPSHHMFVIGITGTNGKTTITTLLRKIIAYAGHHAGSIGTLGYTIRSEQHSLNLTTPDSITLHRIMAEMVGQDVDAVVMEVSSHSLALGRVNDIQFSGGIFTNISQDHLDFHKTLDAYARAKTTLFEMVQPDGFLICNADDPYAAWFREAAQAPVFSFSMQSQADFYWLGKPQFANGIQGTIHTPQGELDIYCGLSGRFNLENIIAAVAAAIGYGIPPQTISAALATIDSIPGRLQEIPATDHIRIFVDYAHTPDAITNALTALCQIRPQNGRLVALYGCGGNRDRDKRPKMTRAVEALADFAILTTDNPRYEKPGAIIADAAMGFTNKIPYKIIENRREAIAWAIQNAKPQDIIVLLGKGHETYQEIEGKRYSFDEPEIIRQIIADTNAE